MTPTSNKLARGTNDHRLIFAYLRPSAIEATCGRPTGALLFDEHAANPWRATADPARRQAVRHADSVLDMTGAFTIGVAIGLLLAYVVVIVMFDGVAG